MITYYFTVVMKGWRKKVHVKANNQAAARNKVKNLYPFAEKITFMYTSLV